MAPLVGAAFRFSSECRQRVKWNLLAFLEQIIRDPIAMLLLSWPGFYQ